MKASAGGLYLDTCVLVSLFHNDSGYAAAEIWLAASGQQSLWISHWVLVEFASATALRMRRRELSSSRATRIQEELEYFRRERLGLLEQGVGSSRNGTSACGPAMACTWP